MKSIFGMSSPNAMEAEIGNWIIELDFTRFNLVPNSHPHCSKSFYLDPSEFYLQCFHSSNCNLHQQIAKICCSLR